MRIVVVLTLLVSVAYSEPVLITQTYSGLFDLEFRGTTFSNGAYLDDGMGDVEFVEAEPGKMYVNGEWRTVTGDWIFRILTDTSNPDLYFDESQERFSNRPHETLGVFATEWITVSNTGLGLDNVRITNFKYYTELGSLIGSEIVGARSGIGLSTAPDFSSSHISSPDGAVGNPNVIEIDKLDYDKRVLPTITGFVPTSTFGFFNSFFDRLPHPLDGSLTHEPMILADGTTIQGAYAFMDANQRSQPVPEPGSFALLGLGAAGAYLYRRRRRAA